VHWNRPPKQSQAGIYFGSYVYIFNVFTDGVTGGLSTSAQCWSRGTLSSIQINSSLYNNIVVFENSVNVSDLNWNVHAYRFKNFISKHIGAIKRVDLDSNRTWLLKSYYIAN
jgi:hypothetical protein